MDQTRPPRTYEELCVWKVFIMTTEADKWQIIERWLRRYGNPFVVPQEESYEEQIIRGTFQEALRFCYDNKTR